MRLATTEEELAHAKERIAALEGEVKSYSKAILEDQDRHKRELDIVRAENERLRALLHKAVGHLDCRSPFGLESEIRAALAGRGK